MLGHVAQSVGGALPGFAGGVPVILDSVKFLSGSAFEWTAQASGNVIVYAFGSGGSTSQNNAGSFRSGAGGGGYCRKTVYVSAGQKITGQVGQTAAVGADGNPSVVNFPDGSVMSAGGGKQGAVGASSTIPGGQGGVAEGGDVNSSGGAGGAGQGNGSPGVAGGAGGVGGSGLGGGGGAGGDPRYDFVIPGAGSRFIAGGAAVQGGLPGGGNAGTSSSGNGGVGAPGGAGLVQIILIGNG